MVKSRKHCLEGSSMSPEWPHAEVSRIDVDFSFRACRAVEDQLPNVLSHATLPSYRVWLEPKPFENTNCKNKKAETTATTDYHFCCFALRLTVALVYWPATSVLDDPRFIIALCKWESHRSQCKRFYCFCVLFTKCLCRVVFVFYFYTGAIEYCDYVKWKKRTLQYWHCRAFALQLHAFVLFRIASWTL